MRTPLPNSTDSRDGTATTLRAAVIAAAIVLLLTVPVILMPNSRYGTDEMAQTPGAFPVNQMADQIRWHEPTIRDFADQLPAVDFREYRSATTPGYHLLMAYVALVRDDRLVLQLLNALFGAGLLATVAWATARFTTTAHAVLLTLPLALSSYVIGPSIWLSTDNLALWFVSMTLASVALAPPGPSSAVRGAVFAAWAVFIRQIHLWAIAPVWLLIVAMSPAAPSWLRDRLGVERPVRWRTLIVPLLAAVLPIGMMACFALTWGGLTPPQPDVLRYHVRGVNLATPAFALAVAGFFGLWFVLAAPESLRTAVRHRRAVAGAAAVAGLLAAIVPTAHNPDAGRTNGGIWIVVNALDMFNVAERSLVIIALAAVGGAVMMLGYRRCVEAGRSPQAGLLLLSFLGWAAAQSVNSQAWQRYFEPPILILLAWLFALGMMPRKADSQDEHERRSTIRARFIRFAPPLLALAVIQAIIVAGRVYVPLLQWEP